MSNIIASGTAELASADFSVAAGTPTTVFLNAATGSVQPDARAIVQMKAASAQYVPVGELSWKNPAWTIVGAGTFRVVRQVTANAFAVDRD